MDPVLERPMEMEEKGVHPKAPGMKYTHYAPKGELTLVEADVKEDRMQDHVFNEVPDMNGQLENSLDAVTDKIRQLAVEKREQCFKVGIMAPKETVALYEDYADVVVCVGDRSKQETVAAGLYAALREFDEQGAQYIYAESFRGDGISYAIMNRLLKAAGHRVIKV